MPPYGQDGIQSVCNLIFSDDKSTLKDLQMAKTSLQGIPHKKKSSGLARIQGS